MENNNESESLKLIPNGFPQTIEWSSDDENDKNENYEIKENSMNNDETESKKNTNKEKQINFKDVPDNVLNGEIVEFLDEDIVLSGDEIKQKQEKFMDIDESILTVDIFYLGKAQNKVGNKLLVGRNCGPTLDSKFIVEGWVCSPSPNSEKYDSMVQNHQNIKYTIKKSDLVFVGQISEIWGTVEETLYTISLPKDSTKFTKEHLDLFNSIMDKIIKEKIALYVLDPIFDSCDENEGDDSSDSD